MKKEIRKKCENYQKKENGEDNIEESEEEEEEIACQMLLLLPMSLCQRVIYELLFCAFPSPSPFVASPFRRQHHRPFPPQTQPSPFPFPPSVLSPLFSLVKDGNILLTNAAVVLSVILII